MGVYIKGMIYPKLSDGTIDWCVMCKQEGSSVYDLCCECEYPENSDDPPTKYEPKPMTNYDRIRAMTDEEFAEFIAQTGTEYSCPPPHHSGETGFCRNEDVDMSCRMCWLDWLRQEVAE